MGLSVDICCRSSNHSLCTLYIKLVSPLYMHKKVVTFIVSLYMYKELFPCQYPIVSSIDHNKLLVVACENLNLKFDSKNGFEHSCHKITMGFENPISFSLVSFNVGFFHLSFVISLIQFE